MTLAATPGECDRCTPERLCFGHKAKTLVFGGTKTPMVREFKHPDKGYRIKQTKDDSTTRGNLVTEHAVGDRQDVLMRPDTVEFTLGGKK